MKVFKITLYAFLTIALMLLLAFAGYRHYVMPVYDGNGELENISTETTVFFDSYGIPHIYASNEKDAMTTLGYVHAQDRLWQMELLRRIAPGRLSEIFGTKTLKADMFFAGIGMDAASQKAIAEIDKNSPGYQLALTYLDGINQFIDAGPTPIEYSLLGIEKRHFTIRDIYNIFGYMSFSFAMGQKTDPLLTWIRDNLGQSYLPDMGINNNLNTARIPATPDIRDDYTAISSSITALLQESPAPSFIGSNSWIIAPERSVQGKVLFANDPHIGFSQPCTWYEAHIVVPGYEIYGFYLAGTPFPLLGHNREYAYGLTMFENDDLDFFRESVDPADVGRYKTGDTWRRFTERKHTILVKDSSAVKVEIKTGIHGPVVNGILDGISDQQPIAMSWVYLQKPLHILEAVYGLSHSSDINAFRTSVSLISAPGLNVMYGDAKGNIAWFASGSLYKTGEEINTNFILDGSNGTDDQRQELAFAENPSSLNPDAGFVYSANNQPSPLQGYDYPGYYLPADRAARIVNLLDNKSKWSRNDVAGMLLDNTSVNSTKVVKEILQELAKSNMTDYERTVAEVLKNWTGTHNPDDIAPVVYNKFINRLMVNVLQDELGDKRFKAFLGTHLFKQVIAPLIENERSVWWDNIATEQKESRQDMILLSFRQSVAALTAQFGKSTSDWKWRKVHTVEFKHPLGSVDLLHPLFNVGPFATAGSNEVINNQFFPIADNGIYEVSGGPSTRRIIDFADIENGLSILPTGQSGNPFSKHYKDQSEMYVNGKFRKMMLNKSEIEKTSTKLIFKPGSK